MVVGTWSEIKDVIAAQLIAAGPRDSGVYAQFVGSKGQALELDNPRGDVVRTLHGNAGLIAATGEASLGQPTWFVTGTDVAGVMAAAQGVHRREAPRPLRRRGQRHQRHPGPGRTGVMIYRRRASPLHAARAAVAIAWCAALAVAALIESNPVRARRDHALGRGRGRARRRRSRAAPQPVCGRSRCGSRSPRSTRSVTRNGLTVIWRLGDVPLLGQTNITLEATVYGAVLGLRAVMLVLIGTLYSVAVDPDEVLRLFRGLSFSSALSATIATRMVPVLVRDSRRLAEAQRCRPGHAARAGAAAAGDAPPACSTVRSMWPRRSRCAATVPRASGRAVDALGGASAWSRHDLAFTASALRRAGCRSGRAGRRAGRRSTPIRCCARPLARAP